MALGVDIAEDYLHVVDEVVFEMFSLKQIGEEVVYLAGTFVVLENVEPN
jgi:hypothetical protein